jgi:hypothetical protein
MCLLAVYYRVAADASLVVGANREELYARGGEPPQMLPGRVRAVTNRARSQIPDQPRSRGLLTRDLLECASSAEAVDRAVRELDSGHYAGCNAFVADAERAVVIHAGEWLHLSPLPPGMHVLTSTRDVDDGADPRIAYALAWLHQRPHATAAECLTALRSLCSDTGNPPICLRGELGGTVSSTLFALRSPLHDSTYLHAQGPPHRTDYKDYSYLLKKLGTLTPDS